jgi:hypothetical protein
VLAGPAFAGWFGLLERPSSDGRITVAGDPSLPAGADRLQF